MNIEKFITLRKHLYHLTAPNNINSILNDYELKSMVTLADLLDLPGKRKYLRSCRVGHEQPVFKKRNFAFSPRDQDPLLKTPPVLESGFTLEEFIFLLNSRVFFWAKEKDLKGHYNRYKKLGQNPSVLKVSSEQLFNANKTTPLFCHLNSGAPSHWTRGLPVRGRSTFLLAEDYLKNPSSVREVTFEGRCKLPNEFYLTKDLDKPFNKVRY